MAVMIPDVSDTIREYFKSLKAFRKFKNAWEKKYSFLFFSVAA